MGLGKMLLRHVDRKIYNSKTAQEYRKEKKKEKREKLKRKLKYLGIFFLIIICVVVGIIIWINLPEITNWIKDII